MDVAKLSAELTQDPIENANHVSVLLASIEALKHNQLCEVVEQLETFFTRRGRRECSSVDRSKKDEAEEVYASWFYQSSQLFKESLLKKLNDDPENTVQAIVFETLVRLSSMERLGEFDNELFTRALEAMLRSSITTEMVLELLSQKYSNYADVRYFTLKTIAKICNAEKEETQVASYILHRIKRILVAIPKTLDDFRHSDGTLKSSCAASEAGIAVAAVTGYPSQRKRKRAMQKQGTKGCKWADAKEQQKQFSAAWNNFLALSLPLELTLEILQKLASDVMPYLATPLTLSDFLTRALTFGGTCGLLSLHGIFLLMTEHNFEYPEFYKRVYGLLTPEVFFWSDRATFFKLLDLFLKSALVPAYTVAAFVKRFARLSLSAPPSGALVCITFIHNLIRRHPACNVLLDKASAVPQNHLCLSNWKHYDCFDDQEPDPSINRAIESSLWELEALGNHWCQQVVALAQILLKDLTNKARSTEKKVDAMTRTSYSSLIQQTLKSTEEISKNVRISHGLFE